MPGNGRKYDKGEVNYREASACGNCSHFRFHFPVTVHGSCEIVKGQIQPEMLCDLYEPDEE
jgi:hypothetical protein